MILETNHGVSVCAVTFECSPGGAQTGNTTWRGSRNYRSAKQTLQTAYVAVLPAIQKDPNTIVSAALLGKTVLSLISVKFFERKCFFI